MYPRGLNQKRAHLKRPSWPKASRDVSILRKANKQEVIKSRRDLERVVTQLDPLLPEAEVDLDNRLVVSPELMRFCETRPVTKDKS